MQEHGYIGRRCDLCDSDANRLLFVKEGYRHVRCARCGLVFVNPISKNHLEGQLSGGTALMGEERLSSSQLSRINRELKKIETFRQNNTFLEIGPGRGWFARSAKNAGWETWVVEVNKAAADALGSLGLDKVIHSPIEEVSLPSGFFDTARLWDVIEHLVSPSRALSVIYSSLRPGGVLRLSTTNFASLSRWINGQDWVYLNGADHIVLFEPATITALLRKVGFNDIQIHTRSFNMRRKRYHPEQELPPRPYILLPFRKFLDEFMRFTPYGHQMIVTAAK